MELDYDDILGDTALEERNAEYAELALEEADDLDYEDEDSFYDDFALDVEYGFEDYEPSPYDGTYSED
jgi:hypothetical protein